MGGGWVRAAVVAAGVLAWAGCGGAEDAPPGCTGADCGAPSTEVEAPPAPPTQPQVGETPGVLGGTTRWVQHTALAQHEVAWGAAAGADGDVFRLATHGVTEAYGASAEGEVQLVLSRSGPDGAARWERRFVVRAPPPAFEDDVPRAEGRGGLAADGRGVLLLVALRGSADVAGARLDTGAHLVALDAEGALRWTRPLAAGHEPLAVAADGRGGAAVGLVEVPPDAGCAAAEGVVLRVDASGQVAWRASVGGPACGGQRAEVQALAFAPDGGVVAGGDFFGTLQVGGATWATRHLGAPFLLGLRADGAVAWGHAFGAAGGGVTGVGVAADGAVVAVGAHAASTREPSELEWAGRRLTAGAGERGFLLGVTAAGAARWAQDLDVVERPVVGVAPDGVAVVAGVSRASAQDPRLFAARYDAGGGRAWQRVFGRGAGPAELYADGVRAVVVGAQGPVLFGQLSHPADFGTAAQATPVLTDTFLVGLTR